jgi:HemY protein
MRRIFFILLLGLLAAVGLVTLIETSPGYVLLSWGKTTIETSLWVGLLVFAGLYILLHLAVGLWRRLRESGGSVAGWFKLRSEKKGRRLTEKGMLAFAGGNWERCRRLLLQAVPNLEDPTLNYLGAARASNKMQDPAKVRQYLDAATNVSGATETVALTRAEMLLDNGEAELALADLDSLQKRERRYPQLLVLRLRACEALERWQEIVKLLPTVRKRNLLPPAKLDQLEFKAQLGLLQEAAQAGDSAVLGAVWAACPAPLKKDERILQAYLPLLASAGRTQEAEKLLVAALKQQWSQPLVSQYGLLAGDNPGKQLKQAETWLQQHQQDSVLLLCLGRLSLRNELWGMAREYFESSIRVEPTAAACAELARLLFNLGEREKSAQSYRQGLLLEHDLPQLPQPGKQLPQPAN